MTDVRQLATSAPARAAYFAEPAHAHDCLWVTLAESHDIDFGYLASDPDFRIVDVFKGLRPWYFDARNSSGFGRALVLVPTLVIDSNIAGKLLSYIEGGMVNDQARAQVERFLRWFASTPTMNVNPAYHLIERFPRSADLAKAESMALRTARAVLSVETMDREYFLATGQVRPADDAATILHSQTGSGDIETVARQSVADTVRVANDVADPLYAFMLKVGLIAAQLPSPRQFLTKIDAIIAFTEETLKLAGPIEFAAAMLQFSGRLRKFATFTKSMSFEAITDRIQHAAWDLTFVRTPQMFLKSGTPERTVLPFVLTGDQDAAAVINLATFRMLLVQPQRSFPAYDIDFGALSETVGDETLDAAMQRLTTFFSRRPAIMDRTPDIAAIIADLHTELRRFLLP
jgi:hypothetical protein